MDKYYKKSMNKNDIYIISGNDKTFYLVSFCSYMVMVCHFFNHMNRAIKIVKNTIEALMA